MAQPKSLKIPNKSYKNSTFGNAITKRRTKQKPANSYRHRQRWLLWVGSTTATLSLFLVLTTGYSYNWGKGSPAIKSLSPATRLAADKNTPLSTALADGVVKSAMPDNSPPATNTSTSNKNSQSVNVTVPTSDSNTINSSSNLNLPHPDPNPSPTPTLTRSANLLTFASSLNSGENIDIAIAKAKSLGLTVDCHTNLLLVKTCTFSSSTKSITTRSLVGSGAIDSIASNL